MNLKKMRLNRESNPDLYDDLTQRPIHSANQAKWRAGHCEFVIVT